MSLDKSVCLHFGDKECRILPYENPSPPENLNHYKKLELSPSEKAQISAMCQQIPNMMAADVLKHGYYVAKWPQGLPHVLTPFKDGSGYMGTLFDESGKVAGQAHFMPFTSYSVVLSGFTLLSIITGQFFLAEINQKLTVISRKIDEILGFLYGDKKAELLSAINFTRYAYENFSSIMEHSGQRDATIQSLQNARMTAMQDVEFYLSDLVQTVQNYENARSNIRDQEMERIVDKAVQTSDCLDLSIQLCMTANLLEVYYSQNYDPKYLGYVENSVGDYISRCERQMIESFRALKSAVLFQQQQKKWDKKFQETTAMQIGRVDQLLEPLMNDKGNQLKEKLGKVLHLPEQKTELCISADGQTVYQRIMA